MEQRRYEEITGLPCETHLVLRRCATDDFLVKSRVIFDHELVYVFGGKGLFTVEGRGYRAEPGKLFYFYPRLVHQCETRGPNHVQFYAVHFSFHYGNGNRDCRLPLDPVNTLPETWGVKGLFAELYQSWKQPEAARLWRSNLLLEQLIWELLTALHRGKIPDNNWKRAEQLAAYIEKHFQEKLTVSQLCQEIGVGEATLYRIFREVWGESPMDYVNRRRIDQARELLYTEDCTIEQVGEMVGIDDPYYFSRLFRKKAGISPRNYRSLFQK